MLRSSINLFVFCLIGFYTRAQSDTIPAEKSDGAKAYKFSYGLRVGGDVGKLIRSFFDDTYSGFELNADYRITQDLYVASEIGFEEKQTLTDYYDATTSGSYLKTGVDYNFYDNWFGMDNMMYGGLRGGFSTFKHNLDRYTVYQTSHYWSSHTVLEPREIKGLTAIWAELIFGLKAEVLPNLYIGLNAQLKYRITETEPENFENIYIPGFNATNDSGKIGVGYGYNLSYRIPLYKKVKKARSAME